MQPLTELIAEESPTFFTGMRLIPAGPFLMGSEGWGEFEGPVHEVFIDDFWMDESPVTNRHFAAFVQQTGYRTTVEHAGYAEGYEKSVLQSIRNLCWKSYYTEERAAHPVVLVSWHDAAAFAHWAGKRLPTEAEWEKAARGGLPQNLYAWGNEPPDAGRCNFGKTTDRLPATSEAGSFPANAFGLFDMGGGVWNWCADWYGGMAYSRKGAINPAGPTEGITRVRRGGAFNVIQSFRLRCANRGAYEPDRAAINIGFRCVKDHENE